MGTIELATIASGKIDPQTASITINVTLHDGAPAQLTMSGSTAQALVQTLHPATLKLADLLVQGGLQRVGDMAQLQVFDCQTVHVGEDAQSRAAVLLLDHGKPSQAAFRLPETQFWQLAQGVHNVMTTLFGRSPDRPN
jgi:hypothetical protein